MSPSPIEPAAPDAPGASPGWQAGRFRLLLSRPWVMGIVNVTPDSFSDGGQHASTAAALAHAERLLRDGADLLDIGGESTRPGAPPVPLAEELARVLPVVRAAVTWGVPVSVDSYKPEVMQACLDAGADIVNDVWALRRPASTPGHPDAVAVVASHPECGVGLMHMHRDPQTMQVAPMEGSVLAPVREFLAQRAAAVRAAGVAAARIAIDPGIGFGKTVDQNIELLADQADLLDLGYPLLVGWSRKSTLGRLIGRERGGDDPRARVAASVAAALMAVERGARILRVHDVRETADALRVWSACQQRRPHPIGGNPRA